MEWTTEQQDALDSVEAWLDDRDGQQVFRLFGFAGTGKTTLARYFAEDVSGLTLFGAYTGKAALVLRDKGCMNASTIHQIIYRPRNKSAIRLENLQKALVKMNTALAETQDPNEAQALSTEVADAEAEIRSEEENLKRPAFTLNLDSDLNDAVLLIVDEVSMVGEQMGADLTSFGTRMLVLGDPAQLPPVADGGYFTNTTPNVMLEQIHRQAEGSPIIRMATTVRQGGRLEKGTHGTNCRVVPVGTLTVDDLLHFDQVLCGRNKTRKKINRDMRAAMGFMGHLPEPGDKVVCLRNNHELGLLNGSTWRCEDVDNLKDDNFTMTVSDLDDPERTVDCTVVRHHFEDRELKWFERDLGNEFDFGYALTVHKAQGSQWKKVCVRDESWCFREHGTRWLYTGVTRAAEELTVIQD